MADSDGKLYEKPVYMEELGDDDLDDVAGGEGSGYRSSVIAHLSYWCSYNDRITRFFNDHF